jgi:peroxiredoxin
MGFTPRDGQAVCLHRGKTAENFPLGSVDGEPISLSNYRGKVVLMAFWTSWCGECMEELTFLQGLHPELSEDVVVLAINLEAQNLLPQRVAKMKKEMAKLGIRFPVLLDTELDLWRDYCINALPTSIIVDRRGKIRFAEPNYHPENQKRITNALAELGVLQQGRKQPTANN